VGIGTDSADNTYQGLTLYGSNPSIRLKGSGGSSWNWIEFVTSAGVNNFSMGVNQTTPFFGIKVGAGMDDPNFTMVSSGNVGIGTIAPAALLDVYKSSTSGWSVRATVRDDNFASFLGTYYFSSTGRPGVYAHNSALNAWSTLYVNTLDGSASNGGQVILSSKTSVGATDHASNCSALDVSGAIRYGYSRRSVAGWFSGTVPDASGTRYFHMKTNMWAGGSPNGNRDYTMSLFKGLFYSYSPKIIREGSMGFHNWSGGIYELTTTGNLWANTYVSSDGYVVLVADVSSSSYGGIVVDWHQNYGYPFQDKNVTATGLHTSASGLY
jgi:hypothetical protein